MSRINHHLPKALHKQIRDIAFDNNESTTAAINRAIENYVNSFGSAPAVKVAEVEIIPLTLEQEIDAGVEQSREFHNKFNTEPDDGPFDEEASRIKWTRKINLEWEKKS